MRILYAREHSACTRVSCGNSDLLTSDPEQANSDVCIQIHLFGHAVWIGLPERHEASSGAVTSPARPCLHFTISNARISVCDESVVGLQDQLYTGCVDGFWSCFCSWLH